MDSLNNTNLLYQNQTFQSYLQKINDCEQKRRFCHHDMNHFLAVARIASIKATEAGFKLSRDLIYTTALLHDIGRFVQYQDKTPHEIASHHLAISLLENLAFTGAENKLILDAIRNHRNPQAQGFSQVFYQSDKLSRACFSCPVEKECDWSDTKKNLTIVY
ncbi:HD domain-containing protein [Acetobacterium woodii]|uniref:Metal-dependent phosphohydrolase n=1 Tax=Acetobacterium woodii (strain ATCC 29683 / DSM 1030 / JCM 2381 / KCTC 1655 / WB1) TaxID=931626 RepID=H6LD39_ACEWD|nr:HD domain-containing protein [Acetobacterium woodii]AFA47878.1 metal-dependent phosphohydrolase [Acetobacterium woodii DSM 1030]